MANLSKEEELVLRAQLRQQLSQHILLERAAGLNESETKKDWIENEIAIRNIKKEVQKPPIE